MQGTYWAMFLVSEKSGLQLAENLPTVSTWRKYEREVTVMGLHCESRLCNNVFVITSFRIFDFHKINNFHVLDNYNRTTFAAKH